MPAPSRRPHLVASVLLVLALALSACGGGGDDGADRSAGAKASSSAADALVRKGLDQLAAGDTESARTTFEDVLALDADNAYGHYNLGLIAQQSGDDATAMEQYDAALATDPGLAPALYNKGILTEATDLRGATRLYEEALAADETMAAAHMRLGFALLELGDRKEAEQHLSRGVELDPSMADVEAPTYR